MNIIIPRKVVAFLRNGIALAIIILVSLWLAPANGMLYQYPFLVIEFAVSPIIAMLAAKSEGLFGFFFVTVCTWVNVYEVYHMWQSNIISYNSSKWQLLGDTLFLWGLGAVLSLIGTSPIFLWRRWRKRRQIEANAEHPYYAKEQDADV